jgi:hypothetical protein
MLAKLLAEVNYVKHEGIRIEFIVCVEHADICKCGKQNGQHPLAEFQTLLVNTEQEV